MKRNELLAKSLTLGLAVATAATSMSVPGGLLAPETVYAADAEDGDDTTTPSENDSTSETKVTLTADNLGDFFSLNQKAILLIRSDGTIAEGPAMVHKETDADEKNTQTWYGGYTLSYKTIGESPKNIDKDFKAGTKYDVYISVNGGTRVNATTDALKLGTVTAYTLFDTDQKLTYKDSSDQTTSVKDDALENTTFKGNVTISAEDGYTVCDSADGNFGETITVTKPEIQGAYGVPVFVKQSDNDTIYARWTMLTFGEESQDTPDTKKEATGTVTITGTATVEEKLIASYTDGNIEKENIAYKWYRIPVSDGTDSTPVEIDGAIAEDYTLTTDDIGCKIKVEVSDKSETVTGTVASEVSAVVAKKDYKGEAPKFGENCFDKATRTLTATVADGTTAAQLEYSLDGGNTWTKGDANGSILSVDGTSAALKLTAQAYNANAIQIRVAETDDTEASKEATYETAIPRKGVDLSTATVKINNVAGTEFTYTGKKVITSVDVSVGDKVVDESKYQVYYTDSTATAAGTNTVAPTEVGDYKLWIVPADGADEDCYGVKSVEFSIKAVKVTSENIATYIDYTSLNEAKLTYSKVEKADELFYYVTVKDEYTDEIPDYELVFQKTTAQTEGATSQADDYLEDISDAGTYKVFVKIDAQNIKTPAPVEIGTVTIDKATDNTSFDALVVKAAANTAEQEYDISKAVNNWTLSGTDTNVNAAVKVDDAYASYIEELKYADGKVSFKLSDAGKKLTGQNEFAIHVDFGESFTNYNVAFDIPVVITDKSPVTIAINGAENLTYDGTAKTWTYKVTGEAGFTEDQNKLAVLITKDGKEVLEIKDAGTYVVTAEYADDTNYGKLVQEITVAPQKISTTDELKKCFEIGDLNLTYDMTNHRNDIIAAVKMIEGSGIENNDYDVRIEGDTVNAGDATVSIETWGGNYYTDDYVEFGTVTIAKGTITLKVTADAKGTPTIKVGDRTIANDACDLKYYDNAGKELAAKPTAPGTYKVKVTYTDDKNLTAPATGEATFTIPTSGGNTSGGGSTSGGSTSGGGAATTPTKDDTKKDNTTNTETKPDGTKVTTTETKAADGSVQTKIELKNDATGVDATVNVAKDAQGKVTDVTADVNQTATGKQTAISAATVAQITEAAGTKDVAITTKTVDANGKTVREVTVNASDLTAGKRLKVVAVDPKTGEKTLVNKTTYKVAADGSLALDNLGNDSYEVVTTAEVNALTKEILASIRPEKTKQNVTAGKKAEFALDDALNMDNVAKIIYKTGKKSVATVNADGTITAKKAGKVTIKAVVTLNNGTKKTVKMTITVKKKK